MEKGFTLIELLAVIVILAIIALIAIPAVVNIINDSKSQSNERSIDLYMNSVKQTIAKENMKIIYNPDKCKIQENGNIICYKGKKVLKTSKGEDELQIEIKGQEPENGIITIINNNIIYQGVVLEGVEYQMDLNGNKTSKKYIPPTLASLEEDYVGYYADVDEDGTVDGIIYADLAHAKSGQWGDAEYSYSAQTELKEYIVSREKYSGNFGEKEILTLKRRSTKKSRFYVMSLSDIKTSSYTTFYWYYSSLNKLRDYSENSHAFGMGKTNTELTITKWNESLYGEQNDRDIWKYIQEEVEDGWFIPSIGEWASFSNELGITNNNFNTKYKLQWEYWTSSNYHAYSMYTLKYSNSTFSALYANNPRVIRLSTTF